MPHEITTKVQGEHEWICGRTAVWFAMLTLLVVPTSLFPLPSNAELAIGLLWWLMSFETQVIAWAAFSR